MELSEGDIAFEEALQQQPYSLKHWLAYLSHKVHAPHAARFRLYERALLLLPGSYKLWWKYVRERRAIVKKMSPVDPARTAMEKVFERCLVFMHKMPRIWIEYLQHMRESGRLTDTRHAFDTALRSLPVTQHHRVWPQYLEFVRANNLPETAVRVYRRYLMLEPNDAEEYIDYLLSVERYDEAASKLAEVVNREKYTSKRGKTNHQLWLELCDLISKHPTDIESLRVEPIIRGGLRRYTDMIGSLWCSLARYHIRRGNFEKARDVYEEGVQTVKTARDFSQVFEAYSEFEQSTLEKMMEGMSDTPSADETAEMELRMARYENLMSRRPVLLSSVLLRQNPHNVEEWQKRVALFEGTAEQMIRTYTEAVRTIDPKLAVGKFSALWIDFAKLYEDNGRLDDARKIFDRAVAVNFRKFDDLADVWCAYAEMELRNKSVPKALNVMRRATMVPAKAVLDDAGRPTVQSKVHRSLKVWALYTDIEESMGTFDTAKAVYTRMLELRVATPEIINNFAAFLEKHKHFEEAFSVYERGIALFKWPVVFEIWNAYLAKFIERYEGRKLERTRELFEQCLEKVPPKFAKTLFLVYANYEEKYGLARHAMAVYERATKKVLPEERFEMWQLYIKRAAAVRGPTFARGLFEAAISDELLGDKEVQAFSLQFAALETNLGEIDRARAIYAHCAQVCDPRSSKSFWQTWNDFEVRHGNEDTFREMLRIKRSVAAQFNTAMNLTVYKAATESTAEKKAREGDAMAMLETEAAQNKPAASAAAGGGTARTAFVKAGQLPGNEPSAGGAAKASTTTTAAAATINQDEIALDDEEEDEDEDEDEGGAAATTADGEEQQAKKAKSFGGIRQKAVPAEVFGGLAKEAESLEKD